MKIIEHDFADYLLKSKDGLELEKSVDVVYIDPPFNCGKIIKRGDLSYSDKHENYQRLMEDAVLCINTVLKDSGSLFIHVDQRESHYWKILLDAVIGKDNFMNEIIWAYDYGGRSKKKWPMKHDSIFWYVMDTCNYTFNLDEVDRIPYMAPGLVGAEKAARGKTPTDVWWHTIVPTQGKEKTGYPTQKPLGILERIVKVHSNPGDMCLDFFAGSGSFGEACAKHGRDVVLIDNNYAAINIMEKRLAKYQ